MTTQALMVLELLAAVCAVARAGVLLENDRPADTLLAFVYFAPAFFTLTRLAETVIREFLK